VDVVVEPLSQHPDAVPLAAEWHFREWGHTDPGGSLEAWTASLGHQALYLYTERGSGAQALYERHAWQIIHVGRYERIDVTVMRTFLRPGAGDPAATPPRPGRQRRGESRRHRL